MRFGSVNIKRRTKIPIEINNWIHIKRTMILDTKFIGVFSEGGTKGGSFNTIPQPKKRREKREKIGKSGREKCPPSPPPQL